jgi:hypothetical protein
VVALAKAGRSAGRVVGDGGLALWGMHIQMSTTAGSESVGLFFVLWSLALLAEGLEENRFPPLFGSALVLNLACAVRYDCWLLIPLLCVLLLLGDKDRVAAVTRSVCYGLLALPFAAAWMQGNERAKGDAFAPIRYIESFHRAWVAEGVARWTSVGTGRRTFSSGPGGAVHALAAHRLVRDAGDAADLAAAPGVPVAHLGRARPDRVLRVPERGAARLRAPGAVRGDAGGAAPALRGRGLPGDGGGASAARAARLGGAALGLAVLFPLVVGVLTVDRDDQVATSLRPVSPVSTNPPAVMKVARWLKAEVAPVGGATVLDVDDQYWDLQIAFFSGLPDTRISRMRWDIFRKQLAEQRPEVLVRREGGRSRRSLTSCSREIPSPSTATAGRRFRLPEAVARLSSRRHPLEGLT